MLGPSQIHRYAFC